jgi:hypothetical protein
MTRCSAADSVGMRALLRARQALTGPPPACLNFAGSNRVNVEDVPRLPTFPAARTLSDPRGRAYFVFWVSPHDGTLTRILRMESVQQGAAVQVTIPDVGVFRIPIVRRPLPRRGGSSILYRASLDAISTCGAWSSGGLSTIKGHSARHAPACGGLLKGGTSGSSIVRFGLGWGCRPPIGFRFHVIPGIPRAVSDPRLILDEFPDLVRG